MLVEQNGVKFATISKFLQKKIGSTEVDPATKQLFFGFCGGSQENPEQHNAES